jgi:hypothetical protein
MTSQQEFSSLTEMYSQNQCINSNGLGHRSTQDISTSRGSFNSNQIISQRDSNKAGSHFGD